MIDLNKIINEKMIEIEKDGFVEKIIEDNLKKCLESVISDVFTWRGPVRDGIENYIKENININLDDLNIPRYNTLVVQAVNKKVKEMIEIQGINKLNECIDKMLMDVKEEYTLSEIIEQLKADDYKEKYEYAEDCIILDSKYNPIIKDKNGCLCWDYVTDWKNPVLIQVDNN